MNSGLALGCCILGLWMLVMTGGTGDQPPNLALARRGCRAFSNGDAQTAGRQCAADYAIDGDRSGSEWASALNGRIDAEHPAIWGVEFPGPETVNKVVIYSAPSAYRQLTDLRLEYQDQSGEFRLVRPLYGTWRNPVVAELRNVATYLFAPVTTRKLRVVISGCGANYVPWPWGREKADAYIVEFEAYNCDLEAERRALREQQAAIRQLQEKARAWQPQFPDDDETGQSPMRLWLESEKLRAGYAIGIDHLRKYAVKLHEAGLNTIINHYWRYRDPDDDPAYPEQIVAETDRILRPLGMKQFIWTALYFYPEDLPHPMDRGTPYRRTVDAFGVESRHGPCPLDEKMWDRFERIARRVAELAAKHPTVQGFQFDWELYAADSGTSRGSFAYNNQQCFCDHCFALFIQKIGADMAVEQIPRQERFRQLYAAGLLDKYYAALGEEVYARGLKLRHILHAARPDLVLGWYGTNSVLPFNGLSSAAEIFAGQSGYAPTTWFAYALARAFGTSRLPMIFMPNTVFDARPDSEFRWVEEGEGWWSGAKTLAEQAKIDAHQELHVLWIDGIIPRPELTAPGLQRAVHWTTTRGNGYWINELYRLTAPLEDPEWHNGVYKEIVGDYWEALRAGNGG